MKEIIVQIGCNRGNDHVYFYAKQHAQNLKNLYLVDANINNWHELNKNYEKLNIPYSYHEYAIVANEDITQVEFYRGEHLNCEHASLNINHLLQHKHQADKIYKTTVPAITLNNFFAKNNLTKINKLFVDVEGLDVDIINSINFNLFEINYIQFESRHSDGVHSNGGPKLDKCINNLISFGYFPQQIKGEAILIKN